MRAAAGVALVTVVAVLIAGALGLAGRADTLAAANGVRLGSYIADVDPGRQACQEHESVPAGAAALEVFAGVYGSPGPALEVTIDGRPAGRLAGGYGDGWTQVRLGPAFRDLEQPSGPVRVCLRNEGDSRLALGGRPGPPETAVRVGAVPAQGRASLRWPAAEQSSWWALAPAIAQRATFGKADLGRWAPALLLAAVWFGALALVLRSVRA